MPKLHPIIHAAGAERQHPDWAVMTEARRRHTRRVGRLLWEWSRTLGHDRMRRIRWRAAGLLHDALKDESPETLGLEVEDAGAWPGSLLHGPACANRLRAAGVEDELLLTAIAFHTTGHADFGALGQALYMADFLEPGRRTLSRERAEQRRRMPSDWHAVLGEVATAKIVNLLRRGIPISPATAGFWRAVTAPAGTIR
ncbi:HD domain-containing protein [Candidatus Palauibacter sp.]|uniref:HD domain-containing protein n=1 Tax=Candidatus Palauibacter sp. TaxID=3101350 RepID=UPI003C6EE4EF